MAETDGTRRADESGWTIDTVREHVLALLAAHDRRYETRFEQQEAAVSTAFLAQEKAVNAALASADRAVTKAETATENRLANINEFRAQQTELITTFMPRSEAEIRLHALSAKIALLARGARQSTWRSAGIAAFWGFLVGAGWFVAAVVSVVYAVSR